MSFFSRLFNWGKKSVVGVDIGTASIKVVELVQESGRYKLANYGIFELQSDNIAVNAANIAAKQKVAHLSDKDLAWGVTQILEKAGIKSKSAVVAISSFPTFATTISIPFISEDEIAKSIEFEARKYIPVPIEDVQIDWSIIKVDKDKTPSPVLPDGKEAGPSVEVFLVAVPKSDIARYRTITKESKLTLKALEMENFALVRSLIGNDRSPICVVNIGGRSTSILIVDNGFQRVSHDYEVGGFEITKIIAKSLNISLRRAEELKRSFGIRNADDNVIKEAMSALLDMMVFETKKTIHNYEELKKTKISKILLIGGLANMPDFVEYFSNKLGREVSFGNPLSRIVIPPELDPIKDELNATFAVAFGLAMRKIK